MFDKPLLPLTSLENKELATKRGAKADLRQFQPGRKCLKRSIEGHGSAAAGGQHEGGSFFNAPIQGQVRIGEFEGFFAHAPAIVDNQDGLGIMERHEKGFGLWWRVEAG